MSPDQLVQAFALTRGLLDNVTPDDYTSATPCAAWTVRDLANHIVEGANWFGLCVDAGAAPDPDPTHGVDYAAGDLLAAYDRGVAGSVAAFSTPGALERTIKLPFGEMPGGAFLVIATCDVVTHGWDLAKATGQPSDLDDDLAGRVLSEIKTGLPDGMRGPEGSGAPFRPAGEAPAGAPPADQLAAFLGRTV
ncbi:MAG: TIGR03086 family protein [Acidimicrobiia bacterium]|nr:TIGR03086 family protein [Acidimicrobiia bacterium]